MGRLILVWHYQMLKITKNQGFLVENITEIDYESEDEQPPCYS